MCCVCENRSIEAPNVPLPVFANGSLRRCERTSSPNWTATVIVSKTCGSWARAPTGSNPNWKRDLLQAIDRVRSDAEWQTYLRELHNVHLICQLGDEKREELDRDADLHNVTPREIAIDDKYDAKFKEVQATLQTLYYRQADLQKRFGANPFAFQFSIVQTSRIQNANCAQHRSPRYAPNDADDP